MSTLIRRTKIGNVAAIIMGQAPNSIDCNKIGVGTPFVKAGEFSTRRPIVREWTTNPLKLASSGDILVCVVGATAGKINQGIDCAIGRSVAAVRPNTSLILADYLYHLTCSRVNELRAKSQGLAQGVITREMLNELEIPLPSLKEQRRIAEVLDRADALRAKRRQAIALLDDLTHSIFLDMFGDPVTNPMQWPLSTLSDLGNLDRGVSKHRPRNDPLLLGGPYPLIQTGDVANSGGYIEDFRTTYSEAGFTQSRLWPKGTLCITIAANIAKAGILEFEACFPDSIVGFSAEKSVTEYVRGWLLIVQESIERLAPESAQKNINLQILRNLPIPHPPTELIQSYEGRIAAARAMKKPHATSLRNLDALLTSIQSRAFRGELWQDDLEHLEGEGLS